MTKVSEGGEALGSKWRGFETTINSMKDSAVKSAKIRRLMEDQDKEDGLEEQTVQNIENRFEVLPPEVKEMIIDMVNRTTDLEMLCLAFPSLERQVKTRKKTIFLFENVLPLICKHLGWKGINKCRLVCEKWNRDLCALLANWNSPNILPILPRQDDDLRLMIFPSPKLTKLCLPKSYCVAESYYCILPGVPITSGQLSSLLEKFPRLEYLDVCCCQVEASCSIRPRILFEQLKTLEIAVGINEDDLQNNLDFLLWFPSLKRLIIQEIESETGDTERDQGELDKNSTVKIRDCLASKQMRHSNVWSLIPSLEVVELLGIGDSYSFREKRKVYQRNVGESGMLR